MRVLTQNLPQSNYSAPQKVYGNVASITEAEPKFNELVGKNTVSQCIFSYAANYDVLFSLLIKLIGLTYEIIVNHLLDIIKKGGIQCL